MSDSFCKLTRAIYFKMSSCFLFHQVFGISQLNDYTFLSHLYPPPFHRLVTPLNVSPAEITLAA